MTVAIPVPARFRFLEREAPKFLWVRGDASVFEEERRFVAIVGARACSNEGARIAHVWAGELAAQGIVIVSGLARGIDAAAHRGALEAGGITVGVLGCGIDTVYPRAHFDLAERMLEAGGAIVSEYEPGVPPAPWRFPARNRIIAGVSDAVIVVEARQRSGALITADFAWELDVQVWAVPGRVDDTLAAGTLELLRSGRARIALGPADVTR